MISNRCLDTAETKLRILLRVVIVVSMVMFVTACTETQKNNAIAPKPTEVDPEIPVISTGQTSKTVTKPDSFTDTMSINTNTPEYFSEELVSIQINSGELVFTNHTISPVLFEAFPQELLAMIEWGPCDNPKICPDLVVQPQETKKLKLKQIVNRDTKILMIFWWQLLEKDGENRYMISDVKQQEFALH